MYKENYIEQRRCNTYGILFYNVNILKITYVYICIHIYNIVQYLAGRMVQGIVLRMGPNTRVFTLAGKWGISPE